MCLWTRRVAPDDRPGSELFIVYPPFVGADRVLATCSDLVLTEHRWGTTPVHVWAPAR